MINGAAKLYRDNFRGIAEDGIVLVEDDGKRHHYLYLEATSTIRSKMSAKATVVKSGGTECPIDQLSCLESWLRIAQRQKVVADALHFYQEDSWINLYKVYEIIEEDVGKVKKCSRIVNNGWATKSDISRFKQTAQSRAVLGDYARHAADKYKPPARPMSLSEAKSLVRNILMKWLITKT